MALSEHIKTKIQASISDAEVIVDTDDEVHFQTTVISPAFTGKNTLQRHRMVYKALGNSFEQGLHAMELKTLTPEQVEK